MQKDKAQSIGGIASIHQQHELTSYPNSEGRIRVIKWRVCVHGVEMPNLLQLPDQ
ncbi:MAG: hypothetical protein PVG51_01425 [Desulfosarcina sp.]|jgi:hypothetical protein